MSSGNNFQRPFWAFHVSISVIRRALREIQLATSLTGLSQKHEDHTTTLNVHAVRTLDRSMLILLEEASTHKSAKAHAATVFVTDLDL